MKLEQEIRKIRSEFPYTMKSFLEDEAAVEERRGELQEMIRKVREMDQKLAESIENLKRQMGKSRNGKDHSTVRGCWNRSRKRKRCMSEEKLKILYLMQILLEETDAAHPMNATQLCERMQSRYEYSYNRKTIYTDIERLKTFGMKIAQTKGSSFGYYVEKRDFDLAELKLLVDAVQSSKFITKEKSEDLIRKLARQTSNENAKQLQRQVFIYNRIKADNDAIYSNVDSIHEAIQENRQIRFKYCEWTVKKKLVQKKGGAEYVVSPWALTWDDANYYLVGFDAAAGKIKHYRVDKMLEIHVARERRLGKESFRDFDLAAFSRKTFGMYGGEDRKIILEGENHLVGVVIDRFGTDVMIHPHKESLFYATVTVTVSPQFFGWLAGIGKGIRISWPEDVREEYRQYLQKIMDTI